MFFSRYGAENLPKIPHCKHQNYLECKTLKMYDVKAFHDLFYKKKNKLYQDTIIHKYCTADEPNKSRIRDNTRGKKSITIKYSIRKSDGKGAKVCRQFFLSILNIKKDRVQGVMRRFLANGTPPKEGRGGDRIKSKNDDKKGAISTFIESLTCSESHYCRSKTIVRKYLPCELNIRKLHKMYNESVDGKLQVKECFFRNYVNSQYNIGFGTPQTDMCSDCLKTKEKLKTEANSDVRKELMLANRVHKLKAQAFYWYLKTDGNNIQCFSFDCQKNLSLPKLADQSAYFSQQFNLYNFTVVKGSSSTKLNPENVTSYLWTDHHLPKNSSVIASALFDVLSKFNFSEEITTVRLFADGCAGQNKNSIVIGMLAAWLYRVAPKHISKIEFIFPVVGHSYMPPDRVFGLIERKVKNNPAITDPEEYYKIISEVSYIQILGKDWDAYKWKEVTTSIIKPPTNWHFQFNCAKRFILDKMDSSIKVRGEVNYRSDCGVSKGIFKRGKTAIMLNPDIMQVGRSVDPQKATSIANLLSKHYGDEWRLLPNLRFYKEVIDQEPVTMQMPLEDTYDTACCQNNDALGIDIDLRV